MSKKDRSFSITICCQELSEEAADVNEGNRANTVEELSDILSYCFFYSIGICPCSHLLSSFSILNAGQDLLSTTETKELNFVRQNLQQKNTQKCVK